MGMCNFIAADEMTAAKSLFSLGSQDTRNYMQQRVQEYSAVSSQYAQPANSSIGNVLDRYNEFNSAATMAKIDGYKAQFNSMWISDTIRPLYTQEEVQQAPLSMRRWIMANPMLRTKHLNNELEGWDGSYPTPDSPAMAPDVEHIGEDHYDYRRVMDSIVQHGQGGSYYTQYHEVLRDPGDMLTLVQKSAIATAWKAVEESLNGNSDDDPTSVWNASLG